MMRLSGRGNWCESVMPSLLHVTLPHFPTSLRFTGDDFLPLFFQRLSSQHNDKAYGAGILSDKRPA
jgi:hypothetical protein